VFDPDKASLGIWYLDKSRATTDVNPALCNMLDTARDSVIGRPARDFIDELSAAAFDRALADAGRGRMYPVILRTADFGMLHAGLSADPQPGGGFVLFVSDFTPGHDDLRMAELRGNAVMNSLTAGVIVADGTGRIERINMAAESIFGHDFMGLVGQNVTLLMPPDYRERHAAALAQYMRTRESNAIGLTRELEGLRANGERFPMEITLSEVSEGDRTLFVAVCRDLTERRRIEAQLAKRESDLVKLYTALTKLQAQVAQTSAPAPEAGKPAAPPPPPPPPPVPIFKMLLVSRPSPQATLATKQGEAAGFQVIHLESGRQALAEIGTIRPHVVVIGFYTKDVAGTMLGKFIRDTEGGKAIPLVLLVPQEIRGMTDYKAFEAYNRVIEFPIGETEVHGIFAEYARQAGHA